MARRKTAKRSARRSSGRSRRGKTVGGSWKKSKGVAIALVGVIVTLWLYMIWSWVAPKSRDALLKDFPYTYMTETSHTRVTKVADSDQQPKVPFEHEESGELCWEAWICNNPDCPGRKKNQGQPFIFPYVVEYLRKVHLGEIDPEEMDPEGPPPEYEYYDSMPACPECKAANLDPYQVDRYQTEEGKKKLEELRKRFEEKRKKEGN